MGLKPAKVWEIAKGFRGRAKNCYKLAKQQAEKALQHAYRHRREKKREHRSLWITRVNAGSREHGVGCSNLTGAAAAAPPPAPVLSQLLLVQVKYSHMMHGMRQLNIQLNRKMLSELAMYEPFSFQALVNQVAAMRGLEQPQQQQQQRQQQQQQLRQQ
jgi:large subunit ribosomal protein L20